MNSKKKKIILNISEVKKDNLKIKVYSMGGQGIRRAVGKLEKSLEHRQDLFLTSLVKYDGVIKGGVVEANIVISKKKKTNPFFSEADICVFLTTVEKPIMAAEYLTVENFSDFDILQKLKEI